jgi:hypothetical protein
MEIQIDDKVPLGEVGHGSVFSGTFGESKVTVKKIQLIDTHNENEENLMRNLNHPNIVKLFHIYRDIYDNFK